jgi:hypothetical protein
MLRAGKGISVQLHLYVCHADLDDSKIYFIRVLRLNLTMKHLLRWREIGCSGNKLLRISMRTLEVFFVIELRGEKNRKRREAKKKAKEALNAKRVKFGVSLSSDSVCLNVGSCLGQVREIWERWGKK